jgi:hypothetical protein
MRMLCLSNFPQEDGVMSLYLRAHPAVHEFGKVEIEEKLVPITWRHLLGEKMPQVPSSVGVALSLHHGR